MTNEEMQGAIEFFLKSQSSFEVQLEKTNRQLEQTNQQLSLFAETQTEFIQIVMRHIETQVEINAEFRRTIKELAEGQRELRKESAEGQRELREAQQQTQRDISELTKIVGGLAKKVYGDGNPPQA